MIERWKDIPGYEGMYEVSDRGRVRSLKRIDARGCKLAGGALRPKVHSKGYLKATLCRDGKCKHKFIHRLVLEVFVGPCPEGMECCHNNGDPSNNRLENLRWGTRTENYRDAVKHGTTNRGERNPSVKLCELDVWLIRNCEGTGKQLAEFFDISQTTISKIKRRKLWSHI